MKLLNGEVVEANVDSHVATIGRSAKCTVQLPYEGMSRHHIKLEVDNGKVFVTDTGSTNGVFIDSLKIESNTRTSYETYLQLSFGAVLSLQIELDTIAKDTDTTRSFTKTRTSNQLNHMNRIIAQKKKHEAGEVSKTNFWFKNFLIMGFLAMMTYIYLSNDFNGADESHLEDETPIEVITD